MMVSCMAAVRACPMCNDPVTFGGGMTITNFSSSDLPCSERIDPGAEKVTSTSQEYGRGDLQTRSDCGGSQGTEPDDS